MSARLITLAINIALMGLILIAGIAAHLRSAVGATLDDATLRTLAARIAVGDLDAAQRLGLGADGGAAAHQALVHGFAWLWWYGGAGVVVLAALSWRLFAAQRLAHDSEVSGFPLSQECWA